jgi:hypothetical protein
LLIKDPEQRPSIQDLINTPIIRRAVISLIKGFEGDILYELIFYLTENDPKFKEDLPEFEDAVSDALYYNKSLPCTISQINFPQIKNHPVYFVEMSEDRLYTVANHTLFVYSLSDLTSPLATYPAGGIWSGHTYDKRFYLGGVDRLDIFEVSDSITEPLKRVSVKRTKARVSKILRVGQELLLGQSWGYL